jgi:teichuronic acid biosynthesis glycosyltransferase TuaH
VKGKNIVMVGQQGWDLGLGSNAHNIAAEFSIDNQVLYINPPLDLNTLIRNWHNPKIQYRLKVLLGLCPDVTEVSPNLKVFTPRTLCLSVNWIKQRRIFRFFTRLNNKLFARRIGTIAAREGFGKYMLFNDSLIYLGLDLKELLQPEKYIYYIRDYMIRTGYFRQHGTWAEAELIGKADAVVANSEFLAEYAAGINARSFYVGQGCDLSMFNAEACLAPPADLEAIPLPRIGYVGYITSERLDLNLLIKLAQAKPEWNFVMVGPEDTPFHTSVLHQLPNVYFLGSKTAAELPAYVQHFQVCLNPQIVNDITVGNYPRKIDEYLAMGKPVVATWTKTMKFFRHQVYLATSLAGYLELIEKALAEDNEALAAARIAFAKSHTWEASVRLINAALYQPGLAGRKEVGRPQKSTQQFKTINLTPQDYATAKTPPLDQIALIHKQEL